MEITNLKLSAHSNWKADIMLPAAWIRFWRMNFKPHKFPHSGRCGFFSPLNQTKSGGTLSDHLLHGLRRQGQPWGISLGRKQCRLWASQLVCCIGYPKIRGGKSEDIYGPSGDNSQTRTVQLDWVINLKLFLACFNRFYNW